MSDAKTLESSSWLASRHSLQDGSNEEDSLPLAEMEIASRELLGRLERVSLDRLSRMGNTQRLLRIRGHVSWIDPALRPSLQDPLTRYSQDVAPRLVSREETIAFCVYLEAQPSPSPPYLRELLRYERLRISIAWGLIEPYRVERFDYAIPAILKALHGPGWPQAPRCPTFLEMRKVPYLAATAVRQRVIL